MKTATARTEGATASAPAADLGAACQAHTLAQIVYRQLVLGASAPMPVPAPPAALAAPPVWTWAWAGPPPGIYPAWR